MAFLGPPRRRALGAVLALAWALLAGPAPADPPGTDDACQIVPAVALGPADGGRPPIAPEGMAGIVPVAEGTACQRSPTRAAACRDQCSMAAVRCLRLGRGDEYCRLATQECITRCCK